MLIQKKKEHLQKKLEEIKQLNRQNERRKSYKAMDKIRKGYQPDKKHVETKMEMCCATKTK
jgi:phage-related protein